MKKNIVKILILCLALCALMPVVTACDGCSCGQSTPYVYESNNDGTHRKTSTSDGQAVVENCSGGKATCLEKAVCALCKVVYGEIGDHNFVADRCTVCAQDMPVSQGLKFTAISDTECKVAKGTCTDVNVYIPSTFEGKKVTMVDYNAFSGANFIKSVVMQENIKRIDQMAFNQCTSLQKVTLPDGLEEIGPYAFKGCAKLKKVVMPDSVIKSHNYSFEGCSSLESIVLSKNLQAISNNMFAGCVSLKQITIPNSVEKIGAQAFTMCVSIEKIVIPKSVTTAGEYLFNSCSVAIKVFCEAEAKPDEWSSYWDRSHIVYWYSATKKDGELCWRYVDGVPTPWA